MRFDPRDIWDCPGLDVDPQTGEAECPANIDGDCECCQHSLGYRAGVAAGIEPTEFELEEE